MTSTRRLVGWAKARFPAFGVSLLLVVFAAGVLLSVSCGPRAEPVVEKVTIAAPLLPHSALVYVAKEKGYFPEEGLDVTFRHTLYGKVALDALIAGNADFALSSETPVVFAMLRGAKILTVAGTATSHRAIAIVALRDRGIESPTDLKGKTIGCSAGTNWQYFLDTFLTVHGIPADSVRTADLKPDELGDALRARRIDGVSIAEPYIGEFRKEFGANAVTFYGETMYLGTWVLTSRREFVAGRPEAVKKLLRSLLKAEAFVRQSPAETLDIVARITGKAKVEYESALQSFDFRVKLDQALLINMENQARWAIRRNLTDRTEVPNFLDCIYLDGLRALRPEAVTIVRWAPE